MDGRRTLVALDCEWRELSGKHVPGWGRKEPALAGVADLSGVLALIRARPDPVLCALLRLGADGDALARRVVLQTMLGGIVRLCRGRVDLLAEALSELWVAIVEYPVARRPRSVAANLSWTVRRRLQPSLGATPSDSLDPPTGPPDPPGAAETLCEARRLGLIDERTHRTLWTVYVNGLASVQAAAVLGTTPEAVRWRCSWALRRLAREAELLA
jgi:DNA-directed RNA polymerase specialized sigma24 family protein